MHLINGHALKDFEVPMFFSGKMAIITDSALSEQELASFKIALFFVAETIELSPPPIDLLSLNVYFCNSREMVFTCGPDNEIILGSYDQIIVYPVYKWREKRLSRWAMLLPMIEELCHAIWQLPDGPTLEEKVTEVLRLLGYDDTYQCYLEEIKNYVSRLSVESMSNLHTPACKNSDDATPLK